MYKLYIPEIKSFKEALVTCIALSGLKDKQIYLELEIDKGQFSKILTGQMNFPVDKLIDFMEICGNDIPLAWLAHQRGYELKLSEQSFEEQLKKEREEKDDLKAKLTAIMEMLKSANITIKG